MRLREAVCLFAVASVSMAAMGAETSEGSAQLKARLAALGDNSWVDLRLPFQGGNQVPAVFDEAHHIFWKYGGCRDHNTEVANRPEGPKLPGGGYSNSCWAVDMDKLDWKLIRPYDCSWPKERPGNGCSRSYTYDSKRKVIWMYGGISNGGGGGNAHDLWTYDAGSDKFTEMNAANPTLLKGDRAPGDVLVYDSKNDLFLMPWGENAIRVYEPGKNAWKEVATAGGPPRTWHYGSLVFDPTAGVVVYPCITPTGKTADKPEPPTAATRWRHNKKTGKFEECSFVTWTYDAAANKWRKLIDGRNAPSPSLRDLVGLTYDSLNKVVILIGGSTNTWDANEVEYNDVWVLDTNKGTWTEMKAANGPLIKARECRHCAYSEKDNAVLFINPTTSLWAYRYKNASAGAAVKH